MSRTRAAFVLAVIAAVLPAALGMTALPAFAQSSSQQAGRPQPPPAGKPTGTQTAKPSPGAPQPAGAKAAPPKKPVPPQTSRVWKGRGFAVVSAGAQVAAPGYTSTAVFKVHAEDATLSGEATIAAGPVFGARGGMRVWKNMAIGGGLELASTSQQLDVTGRLPHPFMFNQYREVKGTTSGLGRTETLVALEASWLFPLARRIDMFVFGGPAYINVRQDMATRIQFNESYPYDTATFVDVETARMSGGGFGATAGVDVSYLITKHLGLGAELRYSYASTTMTPAGQPSKVALGGLQLALAGRILF